MGYDQDIAVRNRALGLPNHRAVVFRLDLLDQGIDAFRDVLWTPTFRRIS